jgi:hypothetical protein
LGGEVGRRRRERLRHGQPLRCRTRRSATSVMSTPAPRRQHESGLRMARPARLSRPSQSRDQGRRGRRGPSDSRCFPRYCARAHPGMPFPRNRPERAQIANHARAPVRPVLPRPSATGPSAQGHDAVRASRARWKSEWDDYELIPEESPSDPLAPPVGLARLGQSARTCRAAETRLQDRRSFAFGRPGRGRTRPAAARRAVANGK